MVSDVLHSSTRRRRWRPVTHALILFLRGLRPNEPLHGVGDHGGSGLGNSNGALHYQRFATVDYDEGTRKAFPLDGPQDVQSRTLAKHGPGSSTGRSAAACRPLGLVQRLGVDRARDNVIQAVGLQQHYATP